MKDRRRPRGAAAVLAAALALSAPPAPAQTLSTRVSSQSTTVDRPITVQLSAMVPSGGELPRDARLRVPPGITAQGPSIGTQEHLSMMGSRVERSTGITATWTLRAARPGSYRIGPGTVVIGGKTVKGDAFTLEVQAAGSGPTGGRPRSPFGIDFFDPFGRSGFPDFPGFGQDPAAAPPAEYAVSTAPDRTAFLRATVTPERAVVGQQVTYRLYAYGARGPFSHSSLGEPSKPDFLTLPLDEDPTATLIRVDVGGTTFSAARLKEVALFPLKTGALTIGAAKLGFLGRGYARSDQGGGLLRESEALMVDVVEPPPAGRPAGYVLGDVGRFRLTATVEPRQARAGESVAVVARLEGTGNLPSRLRLPTQHGVEWMDPTLVEQIGPQGGQIAGVRSFTYLVRLARAGRIDLGSLELPFWDPVAERYETARAALGAVEVTAAPTPPAAVSADAPGGAAELAAVTLAPRPLAPWQPAPPSVTGQRWFWGGILALPALGLALRGGQGLTAALRRRRASREGSPATRALDALRELERARDPALAARSAARALHATLAAATGAPTQALLHGELEAALTARGLAPDAAREAAALIPAWEQLGFSGEGDAAALTARTARLCRGLLGAPPVAP